jgi:uncharacterized membrane protein YccC
MSPETTSQGSTKHGTGARLASLLRSRWRGAVRFALAITVADGLAILVFGHVAATYFTSFCVVALLYFCDFDGGLPQRVAAYGLASILGAAGVVLGTAVAGSIWLSIGITIVIAFALTIARSLFGLVARSVVALQISVLIAVMVPSKWSSLLPSLGAWALGSVIALAAALLVFPRPPRRQISQGLAQWADAAARLALVAHHDGDVLAARRALISAHMQLRAMAMTDQSRPGWIGRRSRLIGEMVEAASSVTAVIATLPAPSNLRVPQDELSSACEEAFLWMAAVLRGELDQDESPAPAIGHLRHLDLDRSASWLARVAISSPDQAIRGIEDHRFTRVLSMGASNLVNLVQRLEGITPQEPNLELAVLEDPRRVLSSQLSSESLWFRHGVQAAIAMGAAVWIARSLGFAHGFWVVMSALALVHVSFTASETQRGALRAAIGTAIGVGIGVVGLQLHGGLLLAAALLPCTALAAKVLNGNDPLLSQGGYTVFAIVNTLVLGWPARSDILEARLIDVLVGLAVAVVAMTLVYPRGPARLLAICGQALEAALADTRQGLGMLLRVGAEAADDAAEASSALMVALTRFSAARTPFLRQHQDDGPVPGAQLERRARQMMVGATAIGDLAATTDPPANVPAIAGEFANLDAGLGDRVAKRLRSVPEELLEHPGASVSALWAAWWFDLGSASLDEPTVDQPSGDR